MYGGTIPRVGSIIATMHHLQPNLIVKTLLLVVLGTMNKSVMGLKKNTKLKMTACTLTAVENGTIKPLMTARRKTIVYTIKQSIFGQIITDALTIQRTTEWTASTNEIRIHGHWTGRNVEIVQEGFTSQKHVVPIASAVQRDFSKTIRYKLFAPNVILVDFRIWKWLPIAKTVLLIRTKTDRAASNALHVHLVSTQHLRFQPLASTVPILGTAVQDGD